MNFVENSDFFGVEASQIPCINGEGAPTTETEGAVGCLYMDTLTGEIYKCTEVSDSVYTWERFRGVKDVIIRSDKKIYVQDAVYSKLSELAKATGCATEDLHKYYTFYYENVFKNTGGTITYTEYVPLSFKSVAQKNVISVTYAFEGYGHQCTDVNSASTLTKNRYIYISQNSSSNTLTVSVSTKADIPITVSAELYKARRHLIVKQGGTQIAKVEAAGKLTGDDQLSWLFTDYAGSSTIDGDYSASFGFANKSTGNGNVIGGIKNNVTGRALGIFGENNEVTACATGAIIGGMYAKVDDENILFALGNGSSTTKRNAITVYKNGEVILNNTDHWQILDGGTLGYGITAGKIDISNLTVTKNGTKSSFSDLFDAATNGIELNNMDVRYVCDFCYGENDGWCCKFTSGTSMNNSDGAGYADDETILSRMVFTGVATGANGSYLVKLVMDYRADGLEVYLESKEL